MRRESGSRSKERSSTSSRLRWQCRRGMRELDELLLQYLDGRFSQAGDQEIAVFESLLALPDPELISYLLQQRESPPEFAPVIDHILKRTAS